MGPRMVQEMLISSQDPAAWPLGAWASSDSSCLAPFTTTTIPPPQAWERADDAPVLSQWSCRAPGLGAGWLLVPTVTGPCCEWLLEAPAVCEASLGTPPHRHAPRSLTRGAVMLPYTSQTDRWAAEGDMWGVAGEAAGQYRRGPGCTSQRGPRLSQPLCLSCLALLCDG